jgi:hypothetical protein
MNIDNNQRKIEELPFEFVLYINDNIICQRFFNIKNYNEDVLKSFELKELMDEIVGVNNGDYGGMGIIPKHLKQKTIDFIWDGYNPYSFQSEDNTRNIYEKIDNFQFEIKVEKRSVAKGQFCGNIFPPKVRYGVNIKEIIPSIMNEIRNYFSLENYTKVVA